MSKPKISVVVCTLNEEKFIKPCLERLKRQEMVPEIIVVDGHSRDRTVEIAKKYAAKIVFDHEAGISDARNVGWKASSSEIVAYCDADSKPRLDWTKRILKYMKNRRAISGPIVAYDGSNSIKKNLFIWAELFPLFAKRLGYNCIWGANMAFKKSLLKKYPFELKFLEDFYMSKRIRKVRGVEFIDSLRLPVSSRRFKKGFYRICAKYVYEVIKILLGKKPKGHYT